MGVATFCALLASASCFAMRIHLPATAANGARAASVASGLHMSAVPSSRRAFLGSATVVAGGLLLGESAPVAAETRPPAADDVLIYVGAGCFWHVQHEMTVAEQVLLGRDGQSFTAVAGYAGGSQIGKDGKVCYHNMAFDSDYGRMGHTEVVGIRVPDDSVASFAEAFVGLFNAKGIRADPQDQGGEYRSAVGLPGGIKHPAVDVLVAAAAKKKMKVLAGRGDEDDTLRDRSIYVYDTAEFPFHAGELYHQYHNDMIENYGNLPQSRHQYSVALLERAYGFVICFAGFAAQLLAHCSQLQ